MSTALKIVHKFFPGVKEVEDATKGIHVEVTEKDSRSSTKKNHNHCAMAVACKRKLNLDGVIISASTAYLVKGNTATRYALPESVSREVVSFDRNGGFEPGEYKLSAPSPTNRIGERQGGNTSNVGKKKSNGFKHITQNIRTSLKNKTVA